MSEMMVGWDWPDGYSAFFEEDDATGYLYVSKNSKVIRHLHIYNIRNNREDINEHDVEVVRSEDGNKFGVVIWRELRGVIDMAGNREHTGTRGITDPDWLSGFRYQLRPDEKGISRAFF